MQRDFNQQVWNETLQKDAERIIQWAINEDTDVDGDLTSQALIPPEMMGKAAVVARESGVVCGLVFVEMILQKVDSKLHWQGILKDGEFVFPGEKLGIVTGPVLSMLTAERLLLNMVGRLSGIASLTRDYLQEIGESHVRLYDTRKTTLGWRRLEKYAVHCGGGYNHRSGLYDAILIKDNHLAFVGEYHVSPADAVRKARDWLAKRFFPPFPIIEVEVDSLEQLKMVLPASPNIVLLDNMNPGMLRQAVQIRNEIGPTVALEASGGINKNTIREIARTGVEGISVGALTHSAKTLDIGLDWEGSGIMDKGNEKNADI